MGIRRPHGSGQGRLDRIHISPFKATTSEREGENITVSDCFEITRHPTWDVSIKSTKVCEGLCYSKGCFFPFSPPCIWWLMENKAQSITALMWKHSTDGCEMTFGSEQIKSRCSLSTSCSVKVVVLVKENDWQQIVFPPGRLITNEYRVASFIACIWVKTCQTKRPLQKDRKQSCIVNAH